MNKQIVSRSGTKANLLRSILEPQSSFKQPSSNKTSYRQVQSQLLTKSVATSDFIVENQTAKQSQYIDRSTELQNLLNDSDNDIFMDEYCPKTVSSSHTKSRSRLLKEMAYLTQKLTPQFQMGIQLISQAEDKVLDFHLDQTQEPIYQRQSLRLQLGEVFITTDHQPIELKPQFWNVHNVRQMEFYYYKIRAKGQSTPFQFYMTQSTTSNFKIFVSSVNPFPTKFSCDQIISVKGWKYKVDERTTFHIDYIYLSMVSELDTQVKLKFQFGGGSGPKRLNQRSSLKQSLDLKLERMNSELLMEQVAAIQKRRREKRKLQKDLIKQNIEKVGEYAEGQQRSFRQMKRLQQDNRIEDVLVRKKQINQDEQHIKELKQTTKELGKILRQRHNFVQSKRDLKNKTCQTWLILISTSSLCQSIQSIFQHKIETIKQSRLMAFQVKRIMKRIHKRLCMIKGVTIYDRVLLDVQMTLQAYALAVQQKQIQIYVKKLHEPLVQRAYLYNLRNKLLETHSKILIIRQMFIDFLLRFRHYKTSLHNLYHKYFKEQFQKYYSLLDQNRQGLQQLIIQIQNGENFQNLQGLFVNNYSKLKLNHYFLEMHNYNKYLKQLRIQKYKKKKDIQETQHMNQPRLFILPSFEEVLDYLIVRMPQINSQLSIQKQIQPTITSSPIKKRTSIRRK